ncbi:hypothetical protein [Paenibacillus wynnii]|uniref:hypothetical protein n=1 Tax=Paenibacillus wynnii TaxID=268407 RepID=UPI002791A7F1|nr:hypothetical protein [Paenibacillus wynnii]MDQ0195285.1 hypothetical protein [Paenibacillus wynnii]
MDELLRNVGLISIMLVLLYAIKKIYDNTYLQRAGLYEDDNVYKAAEEFAQGAPSNDVRGILSNCYDIDDKGMEKILSLALPHRTQKDGGYSAFIKAVNKVLGEDVYS